MALKESETLELKKSTSELKEAVVSIAAILNKHGKGEVYFGVKNDGAVVGQQVTEKSIRDVSQTISEAFEPKIYPRIGRVKIDGRDCILVSFEAENPPYFAFGRAYMRVGDEDRRLAVSELEKLILEKNKEKTRWDGQVADCLLDDINAKAVREFVSKANAAGRIDFRFQSAEATLKKLGLIKNKRLLRAAQALFSSKNPLKVQAALFAGIEKMTFLDIQQFEGQNLFELMKSSEEYIKKHMMWRVKFGKLEREEIPEIPLDALREALVNSVCHRDYYAPESNKIAIFKDRIEIYNPGRFPAGLVPKDFITKPEQSVLRNPLIADGLYRTKDIEKWGSGLKRICDACKDNKVKVEFQDLKTGFQVVFYRNIGESLSGRDGARKGPDKGQKLSRYYPDTIQKILKAVSGNPRITIAQLSKATGLSKIGVKYNLRKLKKEGVLKRVGPDRGGYWEVKK